MTQMRADRVRRRPPADDHPADPSRQPPERGEAGPGEPPARAHPKLRRAATTCSSSAGVAAASGVRRAACSSDDQVAALGIGDDRRRPRADEQAAEVVPRPVGARRAVDVGVDHAAGHRAQVEGGGAERPELLPPEAARRQARERRRSKRRAARRPTARSGARRGWPRRRGRPRSGCRWTRSTTRAASGPSASTAQRLVANHGMPRLALVEPSSGSTHHRDRPVGPVAPGFLRQHAHAGRLEHRERGRVGGEVAVVLAGPRAGQTPVVEAAERLGDRRRRLVEHVESVRLRSIADHDGR